MCGETAVEVDLKEAKLLLDVELGTPIAQAISDALQHHAGVGEGLHHVARAIEKHTARLAKIHGVE